MSKCGLIVYSILLLFFQSNSFADTFKLMANSGKTRVQLIEVYSSESCSSCPPADDWASDLKTNSGLWKQFVPVVFHVDYWNHLNWKDTFSSDLMTQRQRKLSQLWSVPSVYTPAIVVNGKEWRNWRGVTQLTLPPVDNTLGIDLHLYKGASDIYKVKVTGLPLKRNYIVRAAQLGMDMETKVTRGENAGRTLKHNFVVLNWYGKSVSFKNTEVEFKFENPNQKNQKLALSIWIEEDNSPIPLQATGSYL